MLDSLSVGKIIDMITKNQGCFGNEPGQFREFQTGMLHQP
jgi:hypothetical protein